MGHWITVGDDDQHVYVTDSGKIAATRSAISRAGGAKERGKALAARSKAAIGKAAGKVRTAAHNAAQAKGLAKDIIASHGAKAHEEVSRRLNRSAQYDRSVQGKDWQPSQQTKNLMAAKEEIERTHQSHNKAKGRGTPERMALAKYYREDRANTVAAKAALAKATASTRNPVTTQGVELTGKPGNAPQVAASKFKVPTELKVPEKVRAAALAKSNAEMKEQARKAGWGNRKTEPTITPKQQAAQVAKFKKSNQAPGKTKVGWGFNNRDGAKERGKALTARSKAAIGKARTIQHAKTEAAAHTKMVLSSKGPPKRQGLRSAFPGGSQYVGERMKAPVMVEALMKKQKWTDKDVARVDKWAPLLDHDRNELARSATRAAEDYRRIKQSMANEAKAKPAKTRTYSRAARQLNVR